ncbi:HXXEE domain-containing protein [Rhodopseudomonas sp. HC1]|uniref:HXXEE domain-containing protein n=1 Tax=Rhodopseudomonas infernalis TaxID=2897386 RepID=UPI001EE905B4|nr:HXXEE domain-containing protein [Rhodopseudomonas infernalis]MCG6207936.1 HXXEE domain-containing protein [Rhodopseudomonas infernalis]
MIRYLEAHWVAAALCMGVALLLLLPLGVPGGDRALLLIYLASPIYMLHQVEEHLGDRFRRYVNSVVFGGVEALTPGDVLLINLPGVWGINLAALYATYFIEPGWGLAAAYLILVNGLTHVGMAAHLRSYNPGLASAALVFVPFGLFAVLTIPATALQHTVALAIAIGIHAAIALHARHRARAGRVLVSAAV